MIIPRKHKETEILFLVEEADEGGYLAHSLHHSIYTQADTLDELREMVRDAVTCHFDDSDVPDLIRLHIVKDEVIAV
jgi:predicted RNase H-like HicB family nuclease